MKKRKNNKGFCKICKEKIKNKGKNSVYCKTCGFIHSYINARIISTINNLKRTNRFKQTKIKYKLKLMISKE